MEFRVLGPLEVRVDDRPLPLGGTRPRVVLAALLLARNAVVPVDRLAAAIWGEQLPGTPTAQIQAAVSALRKTLGADRIVTRTPGYLVRVERGELDLDGFDRDVAAARRAREEGDLDRAADGLRAALEWWRDDALVDLAELPVRTSAVAVDERRRVALEERIEVDLALRRHADLVPELAALVTEQPLRDRLWAQLMRAQYRCGRRAEALETYRRARQVMQDELGLDPAAELAAVHEAILADDAALDPDVLPLGPAPGWVRPPCPFRALEAYRPADVGIFHGRSAEVAAVVERARAGRVTVVGPSGSGKSSLVLAGVIPALQGWTPLVVRPSDQGRIDRALAAALAPDQPLDDLAARIADGRLDELVTGGERLVVVLDQAEELLTQDPALVDRVVTALVEARLPVVATLRADLLGAVLERPALSALLGHAVFALGAMGPDQLREAVTAPVAGLPGVAFQAGLVERILDDVGSEPGALALLGVTLTLLWDEQVDGTLTHEAYDDLGRVPGALARHAEGEWRRRNLADEEPVLRRLVGHLVQAREGAVTRRAASRGELDDATWRLAERLSATRLLVVTGDAGGRTVELAHEALITHWPRLQGWIEHDAGFHLWRSALRGDLERWRHAGRDPALLVRGTVLADARRWSADHDGQLGRDEIDFVRLSVRHQRTTGRRSRFLRAGLAAAAVLVLVLGLVFAQQRSLTDAAAADGDSRALAARSVAAAGNDPRYAALMAVAAYDRAPTEEARTALFARYRDVGGLERLYPAEGAEYGFADADSAGRVVAILSSDGDEATIWVPRDGQPDRLRHRVLDDSNVEVAADGSAVWLLVPDGIARLDTASGGTRTVVPVMWSGGAQLALSADGTRILLQDRTDDPTEHRVREWSTGDGRLIGGTTLRDPDAGVGVTVHAGPTPGSALVEFHHRVPDDDYRAERVDLTTGARKVVATGTVGAVAGDGSAVVTCVVENDAAVLTGTGADGAPLGRGVVATPTGTCPVFLAGPHGRVVVKDGLDGMRVVDLPTGVTATLNAFTTGELSGALPMSITDDGSRLLAIGRSWVGVVDLSAADHLTPALRTAEVLDDGRGLVGVAADGRTLVVTPLVAGGPAATAPRPSAYVGSGALALRIGDTGILADRVADDRVALRRLPGLEPLATVGLPAGTLTAMYVDGADRLVTVIGQQASWWDVYTGALVNRLDLGGPGVRSAAAGPEPQVKVESTPDPDVVAIAGRGRPGVTLRDIRDGRVVDTLPAGGDVELVRFQRTSSLMAVSGSTGTEVWDTRTRRVVLGPLPLADRTVRGVALSTRPGQLLTLDFTDQHWRLSTYQVGVPGPQISLDVGAGVEPGSVSADGDVVSLDDEHDTSRVILRFDPATWRAQVCAALRDADLGPDDRVAHPDAPDGPVCARPTE